MKRTLDTGFWTHPKWKEGVLDFQTRAFLAYLMTSRSSHVAGIWEHPICVMVRDTGLSEKGCQNLIQTLCDTLSIGYDKPTETLYVRNYLEHQGPGPNGIKAAVRQIKNIHKSPLLKVYLSENKEVAEGVPEGFLKGIEGVREGPSNPQTLKPSNPNPSIPSTPKVEDPLAPYPILAEYYPRLCELFAKANPNAAGIPKPRSAMDLKWRGELAKCARIDKIPEADIVAALDWIFQESTDDFWRTKGIHTIVTLRADRKGSGKKICQIVDAWQKWKANPGGGRGLRHVENEVDWSGHKDDLKPIPKDEDLKF